MIIHDTKRAMQTIMAQRRGPDGSVAAAPLRPEVSETAEGVPDGRHAAASDVLMAIHEGSPQKLLESLAAFHDLHAMHSQKED